MSKMDKLKSFFENSGKFQKAHFHVLKEDMLEKGYEVESSFRVQFNPSELSISRATNYSSKKPIGSDLSKNTLELINGDYSRLTTDLYYDAYTSMRDRIGFASKGISSASKKAAGKYGAVKSGSSRFLNNDLSDDNEPDIDTAVNKSCYDLLSLIEFRKENHTLPMLRFTWGVFVFEGKLVNYSTQFMMFSKYGLPVRMKISIEMMGVTSFDGRNSKDVAFESPDRTKALSLGPTDSITNMAKREYGNCGEWKTIAKANDILNPRNIRAGTILKLPSIK